MSYRPECRSESKIRPPTSRNTLIRNSLQNENQFKYRRSSSADTRARGSGGGIPRPRSLSEERKSIFSLNNRKSSLGLNGCKNLKESRPLSDKTYQKKKVQELIEFLSSASFGYQLNPNKLMPPSKKDFENIFQHLAIYFEPDFVVKRIEEDAPRILKMLKYPFVPAKSAFLYVARTNWPSLLGCLLYLMDTIKFMECIEQSMFFQSVEAENPKQHAVLLEYIFHCHFSNDDNEEKDNVAFMQIIKSSCPYDIEELREKNKELSMALEQVQTELEEIQELKASSAHQDECAKQYEEYFGKMKDHMKKKEAACQKLSNELAEKESELQKLQDILAQKHASYDAQGFDGKKQMSYFENQKKELLEKLQAKKTIFKELQNECWEAELQYVQTLDKGSSTCEMFNEHYSNVIETANSIGNSLRNMKDPNVKNLGSSFSFEFPDCKMQLSQKFILQQSSMRKIALEDMKKKIHSTDMFLNCLASKEHEKVQEILTKKSDLSMKIKIASSQETKKEHDLNAEEKQAFEEMKTLEAHCEEKLKALENIRTETSEAECENTAFKEEYAESLEIKRSKRKMLNDYLEKQKKLFILHLKDIEDEKKECEEAGEEVFSLIRKKLKEM